MRTDGISHAAVVYAMRAFTMLPSGEIDVLGILSDDVMIIEGNRDTIDGLLARALTPHTTQSSMRKIGNR
eukprot:9233451-Pyramimonas_sp.AAC.1